MSGYPTAIYLAVGDTMTLSGSDYVPSSGSYLNLLDPSGTGSGIMCTEGGLIIPSSKTAADQKVAGALVRIRAVRSQPLKTITLHLLLRSGTTDGTSWRARWAQIEHLLEQAAAASGPFGHGTNVCLLVRFATIAGSGNGANFTAFDVVGGVCTQNDLLTMPDQAYGMTLELRCLLHGRLTAQTYPGINVFTALTQASSQWYLGTGTSGPVSGHLGALAQVHIKDTSTAGAINRIRIGRRNVPGLTGGMAATDWQPIVPVQAALGTATLSSPGGTIGASIASITLADSNWHDVCRIYIPGTQPLHQAGLYDCYLRVRESAVVLAPPGPVQVAPLPLSYSLLPPDTYSVIVQAHTGGTPGSSSQPTAPLQVTIGYPWTPNVFADGFESGDTANFEQVSTNGSAAETATGDLTVSTAWALAGAFGLRVRGTWAYPLAVESSTNVYKAFIQRVERGFHNPDGNPAYVGGWVQINASAIADGFVPFLGLESTELAGANQQVTASGAYAAVGDYGGLVACAALYGTDIQLLAWDSAATGTQIATLSPPLAGTNLNGPIWVSVSVADPGVSHGTNYTCTLTVVTSGGIHTASLTTCNVPMGSSYLVDRAWWGITAPPILGANHADLLFDDPRIWTAASSLVPTSGLQLTGVDNSDTGGPLVYLQRGAGDYHQVSGSGHLPWSIRTGNAGGAAAVIAATANPAPANLRPLIGIQGAATFITRAVVPTDLQNNQWHCLYLGRYALPPKQRFEGLNPTYGSGAGDFPLEVRVQAQSGDGTNSNTIQIDALYLLPADEPQVVVEYTGLGNTTAAEWVIDARRDGRVGCVLRSLSDYTTVIDYAEVVGHMELGPGNQLLVFIVDRENGVHDATNTSFGVCMRSQPLTDFVDDSPTRY